MRVLITGATGFVGRALVHALMERGDQRVALTRDPTRARMSLPGLAQTYAWHPLEGPPPAEAFEGVDVVVHSLIPPQEYHMDYMHLVILALLRLGKYDFTENSDTTSDK